MVTAPARLSLSWQSSKKSEGNSKYCRATRISKRVPNLIHSSVPSTSRSHSTGSTLSTIYTVNNFKGFCVMSIYESLLLRIIRVLLLTGSKRKEKKIIGSTKVDDGIRPWIKDVTVAALYTYKKTQWSLHSPGRRKLILMAASPSTTSVGGLVLMSGSSSLIQSSPPRPYHSSLSPYVNVDLFSLIAFNTNSM